MADFCRYDVWQCRGVCWFSFVKPFMVNVSGFSEGVMTAIMMLMGLGMVLGNVFSGKLSSRFSPLRIAATTDW